MVSAKSIADFINTLAPFDTQESWDNSGFLVGIPEKVCKKIAVCLDITPQAIEFASNNSYDIIVSHHPVIFGSRKRFLNSDPAYILAEKGISAVCAHTCLDKAVGGVNDVLAKALELGDICVPDNPEISMLRLGSLKEEMSAYNIALFLKEKLGCGTVRFNNTGKKIKKVAVCGGSGASFIPSLNGCADALITGDAGHHDFLDASLEGITLFAAGHFETENPVVYYLKKKLNEEFEELSVEIIPQSSPVLSV